jgi:hypothetical protein
MKVIWHKAISKHVAIRNNVAPDFTKKEYIIGRFEENLLFIIASVINMIWFVSEKLHSECFWQSLLRGATALSRGTRNSKQLNIYLSSKICKDNFLTANFPFKFFQAIWILLIRPDPHGTFLPSFSQY